ncbi:MAG: PhoH family protein [Gammaproteobacteria bacterium]|nr:PhoH family protein [Gammaproteobacteria bacterium]MCI0590987.1 PhoH family protein [Gammaproteobacteria bacterium]
MATKKQRFLFVLDTNVLMHDPGAIFRFKEHDLYIPMVVLEELDAAKKGSSEVARNVRQVSRVLDELIGGADRRAIEQGLKLPGPEHGRGDSPPSGRLFLQTRTLTEDLPAHLPGSNPDSSILNAALALQRLHKNKTTTLISKDINLRIKARVLGIPAEDYYNDKVLDDVSLLYTGLAKLGTDVKKPSALIGSSGLRGERPCYVLPNPSAGAFNPYQCLYTDAGDGFEGIVCRIDGDQAIIERTIDYRSASNAVWGITARNLEQNFALNLLMAEDIDFVTLLGPAGTGKTLLALAAGLVQTLEHKRFREIVMTRITVPVGEDIGFLPGTEEEKMTPWMGALLDNLEVLTNSEIGGDWGRAATTHLLKNRIKLRSLNLMRGRTFLNRYVIIDEAQNLTSKQMKTLITRAGPGTKVVCLGNIEQIDTPYLTETTSGLTYVVDRFRHWEHSGHITLRRGERSRLADFASDAL